MSSPNTRPPIGARLRALRERLGWAAPIVVQRTYEAAAALGTGYAGIAREFYSKIENDSPAARLTTYKQRAVLAYAYGVSTDELSTYLDERCTVDELLAQRARHAVASAAPQVRYGDHPDWARLVEEARDEDPELTDATFDEVAKEPLFSAGFDILTPRLLAQTARALQNYRARSRRTRE